MSGRTHVRSLHALEAEEAPRRWVTVSGHYNMSDAIRARMARREHDSDTPLRIVVYRPASEHRKRAARRGGR